MICTQFRPRLGVVTASINLSSPASFFIRRSRLFLLFVRTSIGACSVQEVRLAVDKYIHHQLYVEQQVRTVGAANFSRCVLTALVKAEPYGWYVRGSACGGYVRASSAGTQQSVRAVGAYVHQ